jgi:hypothetical protein
MSNFPTPLEEVIHHNVIKNNKTGGPALYEVGESLVVQPNAPHSFFNKSERPCRALSVSTYHHERMMTDAVHPDGRTDFLPTQLTQADFEKLTKSMEKNQTFLVANHA